MSNILDPRFRYTNAVRTNIAETFRKERLRLKRLAERQQAAEVERQQKVTTIKGRK